MKTLKLNSIVVIAIIICIPSFVLCGGVEPRFNVTPPGSPLDDCSCIQEHGIPGSLVGNNVNGHFTISNDPHNCTQTECLISNLWHAHLSLSNGISKDFILNNLGANLCSLTENMIEQALIDNPIICFTKVDFDLHVFSNGTPATPIVIDIFDLTSEYCMNQNIVDDILKGQITISVEPLYNCN